LSDKGLHKPFRFVNTNTMVCTHCGTPVIQSHEGKARPRLRGPGVSDFRMKISIPSARHHIVLEPMRGNGIQIV
jgi:hypothetical protein